MGDLQTQNLKRLPVKHEQIEAIVEILRDTPRLTEIEVRHAPAGATSVTLRLRRPATRGRSGAASGMSKPTATNGTAAGNVNGGAAVTSESAAAVPSLPDHVLVTAGLVGIFHLPAPEKRLSAGDPVQNGQVLGRIESMRLLTDCLANADGVVSEVLVQDGQPVEYGQPLFGIRPQEGSDE